MAVLIWLLVSFTIIIGGIWLCVKICTYTPRAQRPAPPVAPPAPEPEPQIMRRWGHQRRASVAADKDQWNRDFGRLLS